MIITIGVTGWLLALCAGYHLGRTAERRISRRVVAMLRHERDLLNGKLARARELMPVAYDARYEIGAFDVADE